jgi:uncharacterized protein YjbI with pentapeptide repeats
MRGILWRYRIELGTFLVCGAVCLFVVWPLLVEQLSGLTRMAEDTFGAELSGIHVPQPFDGGSDVRTALAERVAEIRTVLGQPLGRDDPVAPWEETQVFATPPTGKYRICQSLVAADFSGVDLHGMDFRGINLARCRFDGANLQNTLFEGAFLKNASFDGADFSGTDFTLGASSSKVIHHDTVGADFRDCNLAGMQVSGKKVRCDLRGADLRGATLVPTGSSHLDIRGADLRNLRLSTAGPSPQGDVPPRRGPKGPKVRGVRLAPYWSYSEPSRTADHLFDTLVYDETTRVEGMRLGPVEDESIPFVQWAISRGAIAKFPYADGATGLWHLRNRYTDEIICSGDSPRGALLGRLREVRDAIREATGLDYPQNATWPTVENAIHRLPVVERAGLFDLIGSTVYINLQGVDLSGADLRGANLARARLDRTSLVGTDLSESVLHRASIHNSDLSEALFGNCDLTIAAFRATRFDGAELVDCGLQGSGWQDLNLTHTRILCGDLSRAVFENVVMENCFFEDLVLTDARFTDVGFSRATLDRVDWSDARLTRVTMDGSIVRENDFAGLGADYTDFYGVHFEGESAWRNAVLARDRTGMLFGDDHVILVAFSGGRVVKDGLEVNELQRVGRISMKSVQFIPGRGVAGTARTNQGNLSP